MLLRVVISAMGCHVVCGECRHTSKAKIQADNRSHTSKRSAVACSTTQSCWIKNPRLDDNGVVCSCAHITPPLSTPHVVPLRCSSGARFGVEPLAVFSATENFNHVIHSRVVTLPFAPLLTARFVPTNVAEATDVK